MSDDIEKEKQIAETQLRKQRRVSLYSRIFNTPDGRDLLKDLKQNVGYDKSVFTRVDRGNHMAFDPLNAALKDGARGVIVFIEEILATPLDMEGQPKKRKPAKKGIRK